MSIHRLFLFLVVAVALLISTGIHSKSQLLDPELGLFVGRNVNLAPYPTIGSDGLPVVNSGDPYLQRQNEPSMAVSTRNPMHLLAATNDYRTVYIPDDEQALPGIELAAQAPSGDAWLGIFKSYNGGQSWATHLLPGYPQDDYTVEGNESLLKGYAAACDPTVRAGSSGLFFTSGIVFDRIEHGGSGIFVARYIDNNTQAIGEMDSIEYIDVNMIDEGTSGQFADKPWIAVAAPTDEYETVPIVPPPSYAQSVPMFDVYMVYSIFLGSSTAGDHSHIMFAKSSDCGNSWGRPFKLSESVHVCQGTNVVVSPTEDGTIYVVWRQYSRGQQDVPDAIVMCKSTDRGQTFTKAEVIAEINPFDQFTAARRFRTSAFPAIAVDHNGLVYVAWSQRRPGEDPLGEARIVIKTSMEGINWDGPTTEIDDHDSGHQIMPSLAYAGGKLMATWYDTRNSPENGSDDISGVLQTMDVRAAQADPSVNPVFGESVQVSRYLYTAETDPDGNLVGENPDLPVSETNPPDIYAAQSNHPNYAMFDGGGSPFMGDYLDSAPSPMFLRDYDEQTGTWAWRFNTGEGPFDPTLCHIVFACNRDVVPPEYPLNWTHYSPPGTGCMGLLTTGMRDQNVYTAPLTQGIQVYCPVNTKPLSLERSSFLVFVRNLTDIKKDIRLTIDAPLDMIVSFWEFGPPQQPETSEECQFQDPVHCAERIVEMPVLPHSSITLTVFVREPYDPSDTTFRVNVEEIDGLGDLTGLKTAILLNPDPVNTNFIIPGEVVEYHTPFVITEDVSLVDCDDATVFSGVVFTEELLAELLEYCNPDYLAPTRRHPTRRHEGIINPTRRHSSIGSAPLGEVTDVNWSVKNAGAATAAYSFDLLGETPSVPYQLLIYRVNTTQQSEGCDLSEYEHHELLLSYEDPSPLSPTRRHEDLRNPTRRHNTFFLAPGETAICTLRLIDPNLESESGGSTQEAAIMSNGGTQEDFDPEFYANTVTGAFIPQAANDSGVIVVPDIMWIYTDTLPDVSANHRYPDTQLEAEGGSGSYSWDFAPGYDNLPPGLHLDLDGRIWGKLTRVRDRDVTYPITYNFAVMATDTNTEEIVYRSLSIRVIKKKKKK